MPTFKPKDKVFYRGREATVYMLDGDKHALIEQYTYGGKVHTPGWVTRRVKLSSLSKTPPEPKSKAQRAALVMLYKAELDGVEIVRLHGQKHPLNVGVSGWLKHYGYIVWPRVKDVDGYKYELTTLGRKFAKKFAAQA